MLAAAMYLQFLSMQRVVAVCYDISLCGTLALAWLDIVIVSGSKFTDFGSDHFLASHGMHAWILGLSLVASLFSGYSVVGVPAEAYRSGFAAFRWIGSGTFVTFV